MLHFNWILLVFCMLVFYDGERTFCACFRENWVYKFGHGYTILSGGGGGVCIKIRKIHATLYFFSPFLRILSVCYFLGVHCFCGCFARLSPYQMAPSTGREAGPFRHGHCSSTPQVRKLWLIPQNYFKPDQIVVVWPLQCMKKFGPAYGTLIPY